MKLFEYVNKTLKEYGCRKAFGVPGKLVMPIWQNLDGIEIILCSHEQEASYVATAYAKASGELVAVLTTGSPAVSNCATGIASANMDSVPMIYISGRTPSRIRGCGLRQEESNINRDFNSIDLTAPLTKTQMEINDISTAAQQFTNACDSATSDRPGCVHLSIDMEVQVQDLPEIPEATSKNENTEVVIPEFPEITKPLIILGWGAWQAKAIEKAYDLAEKIGAPVLVTSKGSSCIWAEHPSYLGKLGYSYNEVLDDYLKEYAPEQVLVFGSSMGRKEFSEHCINILEKAETYLYTIDFEDVISRYPKGHWFETEDMALTIDTWLKDINSINTDIDLKPIREKIRSFYMDNVNDDDLMARAIFELNNLCDDTCVITADAGNHLEDAAILYDPPKPGGMFLDVGIRTMGTGICSSVGMALAHKDKFFIAITGDGTMLMNGNVMYLAKQHDLPVLFLVINNTAHGRVRVGQIPQKKFIGTTLADIDFNLYGKAFGLETYKAHTMEEFQNAVKKIKSERKTALLEFFTDKDEIPVTLKGKKLF